MDLLWSLGEYLLQALQSLDAQREQLLGLQGSPHPVLGRLQVALALLAPEQRDLLLDALCDVHLGPDAVHAHIGRVGRDGHSTQAAQPSKPEKSCQMTDDLGHAVCCLIPVILQAAEAKKSES